MGSVHHHRLLWREQQGAGATPQGGSHPFGGQGCSTAQLLCRGPLLALRGGSGQGEQVVTLGLSLSKGIDTSDNQCFSTLLPRLACPRLCREVKPDTKSLADVLWSPLKWARTEMGRMEGLVQLSSNPPSRGGPRALSAGPGVYEGFA